MNMLQLLRSLPAPHSPAPQVNPALEVPLPPLPSPGGFCPLHVPISWGEEENRTSGNGRALARAGAAGPFQGGFTTKTNRS